MNDNIPAGAEFDSSAPWNVSKEQEQFDKEYEEALLYTRSALADDLPELIWDILKDCHNDVREAVYTELFDEAKNLWES